MPDNTEVELKDSKAAVRVKPVEILVTDRLIIHQAQGATITKGLNHLTFRTRVKPKGAINVVLSRFPNRDSFILLDHDPSSFRFCKCTTAEIKGLKSIEQPLHVCSSRLHLQETPDQNFVSQYNDDIRDASPEISKNYAPENLSRRKRPRKLSCFAKQPSLSTENHENCDSGNHTVSRHFLPEIERNHLQYNKLRPHSPEIKTRTLHSKVHESTL